MEDYVAVGFDITGTVKAYTSGSLDICKSAAKLYRRRERGIRVYPVVKIMPWSEWNDLWEELYGITHLISNPQD